MIPALYLDPKLALASCEPIAVVGKKRPRAAEKEAPARVVKKNRQDDVLKAIGDKPVTERHILETVGDNRYTREILRRLMALEVVQRMGRGGSNDPFLYRVVKSASEVLEAGIVDPASDIRMQRIENKILALLAQEEGFVTEKQIRSIVGDNTGTGKALRRLVKNSRVLRVGRGGAGDPFTYQANKDAEVPFSLDATTKTTETSSSNNSSSTTPVKKQPEEPESRCMSPMSPCEQRGDELEDFKALSDRSTVASSKNSVTDETCDEQDRFDDEEKMSDASSAEEEEEAGSIDLRGVVSKLIAQHGAESHLDRYLKSACHDLEREVSSSLSHSEDEMDAFGIVEVEDDASLDGGDDCDAMQEVPEGMIAMASWVPAGADGDNEFVDSLLA